MPIDKGCSNTNYMTKHNHRFHADRAGLGIYLKSLCWLKFISYFHAFISFPARPVKQTLAVNEYD
jgi:hypothetical protein